MTLRHEDFVSESGSVSLKANCCDSMSLKVIRKYTVEYRPGVRSYSIVTVTMLYTVSEIFNVEQYL